MPLTECLVDGVRYFRPDDLPPAGGRREVSNGKSPAIADGASEFGYAYRSVIKMLVF